MPHGAVGYDVPVEVENILKRSAGVGGKAKALGPGLGRDPRSDKHKPSGELRVGELGDRANVPARYDEHVERRGGRLRVKGDDIGIFVADRRRSGVSDDPTEHAAVPGLAPRTFTRPSRSAGLSPPPSSTSSTSFSSHCRVG